MRKWGRNVSDFFRGQDWGEGVKLSIWRNAAEDDAARDTEVDSDFSGGGAFRAVFVGSVFGAGAGWSGQAGAGAVAEFE
jgi:hypothetical protein